MLGSLSIHGAFSDFHGHFSAWYFSLQGEDVDSDDGLHDIVKPKKKKPKKEKALGKIHRWLVTSPWITTRNGDLTSNNWDLTSNNGIIIGMMEVFFMGISLDQRLAAVSNAERWFPRLGSRGQKKGNALVDFSFANP